MSHTMTLELLLCITGMYILSLALIFKVLWANTCMCMCNLNLSSLTHKKNSDQDNTACSSFPLTGKLLRVCMDLPACVVNVAPLYIQFKCVKHLESPYDEFT